MSSTIVRDLNYTDIFKEQGMHKNKLPNMALHFIV